MPDKITAPLKIALLSDPHLKEENDNHFKQWLWSLEKAAAFEPDLYLIAGDLTSEGSADEAALFKKSIANLPKPVFFVPGNHDIGNKKLSGKGGEIDSSKIAFYRKHFGKDFFATQINGCRIIGLNSQLFQSGLPEEKEQEDFLYDQMDTDHPKLLLMHTPLFIHDENEPGGDYWNVEDPIRGKLLSLIENNKVIAVLSGHLHRLVVNHTSTLFISSPPLSFGLPEFHLGQSFLTLEIRANQIHYELHQIKSLYNK